jgi:hypothetical protein
MTRSRSATGHQLAQRLRWRLLRSQSLRQPLQRGLRDDETGRHDDIVGDLPQGQQVVLQGILDEPCLRDAVLLYEGLYLGAGLVRDVRGNLSAHGYVTFYKSVDGQS